MIKFSIKQNSFSYYKYKNFPSFKCCSEHRLDGYILIKSVYAPQKALVFFAFQDSYCDNINQIKSLNHKIMKSKKTSKYYVDKDII